MKIAIIGAGFTGLTAAYRLTQKGHEVTIFEKGDNPGGLALGFKKEDWDWTLEEYYHHWFTNDVSILSLAKELNYPVITKRPKTSSYINGKIYQLDSPVTLLTFPLIPLIDRLRMACVLAFLRLTPFWKPLEKYTADSFLPKTMGKKSYDMLWEPLLRNKFGQFTPQISLAWFWARIKKRTASLAYPQGGFLQFAKTLAQTIQDHGGTIIYGANVAEITPKKKKLLVGSYGTFDKVIVTIPSFSFTRLVPSLPEEYVKQIASLKGIGAIVLVLRLRKKFLPDDSYWLNVCDKNAPILAVVEHTNFIDKNHYNNEHVLYLGNYLSSDHPYFSKTKEALLQEFDPFLKKINPTYDKYCIGMELFKTPFAQPIIPINYSKQVPPFKTPIENLYLATMQQVYPWDRGTNYAVALGEEIATVITHI